MTKRRAPLTVENALFKVIGQISIERAAEVTGREPSYLRSMSDPDSRYCLSVENAVALDIEYQATGGIGAPIYETYGLLLNAAQAERFAQGHNLARHASEVIRECGEAGSALVVASMPGADARDQREAKREIEEAIASLTVALPLVDRLMREASAVARAPP